MKWRKLGKLFDPTNHKLPNNCFEYAQSPQTVIFDDFVRIYFSTREKDNRGKFLSHVAFVDFDKYFQRILRVSDAPVIKLGNLGCFDEHGIFPFNVLRMGNTQLYAYTTGWNRKVSVPTDGAIGLAISDDDGLTFSKVGIGPILTASLYEPFLVGDPFVMFIDGTFHMWYICGTRWTNPLQGTEPDRIYKIMHATSANGFDWEKEGKSLIKDRLDSDECQALPSVINLDGLYHMVFCYRHASDFRKNKERAYRIGHAFSNDLIKWTRADDQLSIDRSSSGWDSEMLCYPHIFECNGNVYLLYNGNEFGRFGFGLAILEQTVS